MCGAFLSRSLDLNTERKARTMNPNQMNVAKAMVAQHELLDEAVEARRRARSGRPRATRKDNKILGLLRRR